MREDCIEGTVFIELLQNDILPLLYELACDYLVFSANP